MLNSFTNGIFNYEDFMRQILNIKGHDIDNQDTRFYVFTTATIAPNLKTQFEIKFCKTCKMARVACKCKHDDEDAFEDVFINGESLTNSRNLLFNTSDDNGSVYRLFPFSRKGYKVPSLYVYTSQKPQREMVKSINENFGDFLEGVHPRFARNLIKFVECWYMKNTSKSFKFKMKKEDVLIKLGDLLLNQYRVTPKIEKIEDHSTRFAIWVQALKCVDITVTRISNRKLSNLLEPFNLIIQNHLNEKIQIRSDCDDFEDNLTITSDYIRKMKDSALKFYISDEVGTDNSSNISLNNLYLIFWKAGLMPLILNVDDKPSQKYVFQVINLLKTRGLIRRYLINTNDENIRLSAKSWKNLSFFINLGDIANKLDQNLMDSVKIKILNYNISLGKIRSTDPFFQNSIFPYEFFEMILSKYQLKIDTYHVGQKEVVDKLVLNHKLILDILQLIRNNDVNIVDDNVPIKMLRDINPNLFA
ncbi:uncharacterized protein LOC126740097 isoform X2 [Anthonomus grandis grandis]|nr:uncharacterized protein LOC126740097 isoform X2 [Anthonomus grandis grandis]